MRGESDVMVCPLAKDCHQVGVEGVTVHFRAIYCQDTVGHFSHLREKWRQR